MAEDVAMTLQLIGKKLDNVTEEVIGMRTSIANIENNTEVRVMNGDGFEVPIKTGELLKHLYEHTKAGGIIDIKFQKCKEDHSAQKRFGNFNKSAGTFIQTLKIVGTVILFIMVILGFLKSSDTDDKMTSFDKKLDRIEKLSK